MMFPRPTLGDTSYSRERKQGCDFTQLRSGSPAGLPPIHHPTQGMGSSRTEGALPGGSWWYLKEDALCWAIACCQGMKILLALWKRTQPLWLAGFPFRVAMCVNDQMCSQMSPEFVKLIDIFSIDYSQLQVIFKIFQQRSSFVLG